MRLNGQAGWIAEMLIGRYGEGVVFKDFDSIKPGDDLVEVINEAVGSCEVLLALIGHRLLSMTGPDMSGGALMIQQTS